MIILHQTWKEFQYNLHQQANIYKTMLFQAQQQ